eukprot:7802752-Alexandrium_andersonii.AAC.1
MLASGLWVLVEDRGLLPFSIRDAAERKGAGSQQTSTLFTGSPSTVPCARPWKGPPFSAQEPSGALSLGMHALTARLFRKVGALGD